MQKLYVVCADNIKKSKKEEVGWKWIYLWDKLGVNDGLSLIHSLIMSWQGELV